MKYGIFPKSNIEDMDIPRSNIEDMDIPRSNIEDRDITVPLGQQKTQYIE